MPLFEYACRECDNHFELLVRESTKLECPKCSSPQLDKQLSVFAVSAPSSAALSAGPVSACGACGDPRGPGSCGS